MFAQIKHYALAIQVDNEHNQVAIPYEVIFDGLIRDSVDIAALNEAVKLYQQSGTPIVAVFIPKA